MGVLRQLWRQPQRVWLRRALFQIHLWTGIGLGIYVVLISVSGSAVVFRQDIYRAIETPVILLEPVGERWTIQALTKHVEKEWPGYEVTQTYEDESKPNRAIEITFEKGWSRHQRLFNPYTGEDLGPAIPWMIRTVSWFEDLHFNLFGGTTGRRINAAAAGLFTILAISGAVVWWQGIQNWKRGLLVRLKSGWKRFNWDLHSAAGFWTFLFVLMWGITGIFVAIPDPFRQAVDYLEPLKRIERPAGPPAAAGAQGAERGERGQRGQRGLRGGGRRPLYEPRVGDQILRGAYSLHFGNFGGVWVKALWVILGLVPVLLFVSGTIMWWNRVIRRNRSSMPERSLDASFR
jgi:uncharacterized iron-regulated membrane protein